MAIGFASLAGVRVVAGSFAIPLFGMWSGDVALATDASVPADTTLTVGNLSLKCHVYRQALFAGERRCRLVAGAGGWRREVPARHYDLPTGIPLSLVLRDAASEVGERVVVPNDSIIGVRYTREAAKASLVLRDKAGPNWYVDPSGVTQIKAWPSSRVSSAFTVEKVDGAAGVVTVATEDYVAWLPGATFTSQTLGATYTNRGVRFGVLGDGQLRLEVMT